MPSRNVCIWSAIVVVSASLLGCGQSTQSAKQSTGAAKTAAPAPIEADAAAEPEKKPAGNANDAATADSAVRQLLHGLGHQQPRAIWDFLPASFQKDVNDVVHEFAGASNRDAWTWTVRLAEDLSRLLKTKKQFFLSFPRLKQSKSINAAELEKNWDSTVALLDTLLQSDLADPKKMQTMDVGVFLETTGGRVMSQLAEISKSLPNDPVGGRFGRQLGDMKAEMMRSEGEKAVVKLSPADPKVPPTDVTFVLVEGKWIPQPLAEGWKPGVEQVRARIAAMKAASESSDSSQGPSLVLSQFESTISELQAIDDEKKFHERLDAALAMVAKLFGNSAAGSAERTRPAETASKTPPSADDFVTVVIEGQMDKAGEEALCNQLTGIVDDENLALAEVPVSSDGSTTIRVWPVVDVAAFATRIDFARVVNVDAAAKTIAIEPNPVKE